MRVVFFGTAEFAVASLDALIAANHEILAVVTQPDKPQGRGRQLFASPVKQAALRCNLPVMQPRRVRAESFIEKVRALAPDVLAVAAFGQIVPQALLDVPPFGPINVHGSLLPKYRGAAPIQRAIMAGEAETGVTTMWMDATLDTGDMLLADSISILPDDTAGTITPRLAELGARLLVQTLDGLAAGTLPRRPQDDSQATLAPPITPADSLLDWHETAAAICSRVRGVSPKPGAYTQIGGKRVKVWMAQPAPTPSHAAADDAPGTILGKQNTPPGVLVAAGDGTTALLVEVQPDSGKRMPALAWYAGQRFKPGDRFEQVAPQNNPVE